MRSALPPMVKSQLCCYAEKRRRDPIVKVQFSGIWAFQTFFLSSLRLCVLFRAPFFTLSARRSWKKNTKNRKSRRKQTRILERRAPEAAGANFHFFALVRLSFFCSGPSHKFFRHLFASHKILCEMRERRVAFRPVSLNNGNIYMRIWYVRGGKFHRL